MQIQLQEASLRLADLLRAARRGEPVFIVAPEGSFRLEAVRDPASEARVPTFGGVRGSASMREDFDEPLPDFDAYAP
jgi:antitoxin (DNA-binding transcriptional repressor) of toxin-antitoxin stability system